MCVCKYPFHPSQPVLYYYYSFPIVQCLCGEAVIVCGKVEVGMEAWWLIWRRTFLTSTPDNPSFKHGLVALWQAPYWKSGSAIRVCSAVIYVWCVFDWLPEWGNVCSEEVTVTLFQAVEEAGVLFWLCKPGGRLSMTDRRGGSLVDRNNQCFILCLMFSETTVWGGASGVAVNISPNLMEGSAFSVSRGSCWKQAGQAGGQWSRQAPSQPMWAVTSSRICVILTFYLYLL